MAPNIYPPTTVHTEKESSKCTVLSKNKRGRLTGINCISRDVEIKQREISGVDQQYSGEWELIKVVVDSGAIDTVTPPHVAKAFPTMETDASEKGLHCRAANGSKITNHGARTISGVSSNYSPINMTMNVADVKKTLASAYQIVQAGNKIILDAEYSYIVNSYQERRHPSR